jgi:hypothetical protein
MTENLQDQVIRPSYEQARDTFPDKGARDGWARADRDADRTRAEIAKVHDNPEITDETKAERIQAIIDRNYEMVAGTYRSARAQADEAAKAAYARSIPLPGGDSYVSKVKDPNELLAIGQEADRISERISGASLQELTKSVSRNPGDKGMQHSKTATADTLRSEYGKAMEMGALEGRVLARAVLKVADAVGADAESIIDEFRETPHRDYLAQAQKLEQHRMSIPSGKDLSRHPYDNRRGPNAVGVYRSGNHMLAPGSSLQTLFANKPRRKSWK